MPPIERPLTDDEFDELRDALQGAVADLGVSRPDQLRSALEARVEAVRADPSAAGGSLDDAGFRLGLLLGQQICEIAGWQWVHLAWDNGFEAVGVVPDDRSFVCLPMHLTYEILKDRDKENTLGLLLDTLAQGAVPPAQRGAYIPLS